MDKNEKEWVRIVWIRTHMGAGLTGFESCFNIHTKPLDPYEPRDLTNLISLRANLYVRIQSFYHPQNNSGLFSGELCAIAYAIAWNVQMARLLLGFTLGLVR